MGWVVGRLFARNKAPRRDAPMIFTRDDAQIAGRLVPLSMMIMSDLIARYVLRAYIRMFIIRKEGRCASNRVLVDLQTLLEFVGVLKRTVNCNWLRILCNQEVFQGTHQVVNHVLEQGFQTELRDAFDTFTIYPATEVICIQHRFSLVDDT